MTRVHLSLSAIFAQQKSSIFDFLFSAPRAKLKRSLSKAQNRESKMEEIKHDDKLPRMSTKPHRINSPCTHITA